MKTDILFSKYMQTYFLDKISVFLYFYVTISVDGSQELFLSYFRNGEIIMDANEKKLAAEARNAYARKWRAANPDKVRANNANYWLRRAAKEAARKEAEEAGKDGNDA